jgi:hypothetical protein
MESWLVRGAGAYEGDFVAEEAKGKGIDHLFSRSTVYVRGELEAFGGSTTIREAASTSFKDALLACLGDPPVTRSEKTLLARVRGASTTPLKAASVHRLHEIEVGLLLSSPQWEARVETARDIEDVAALRTEFEKVSMSEARDAMEAELLSFAVDEPADKRAPAELDGERPHAVRFEVVDLHAEKVLVRLRKNVDPSALSSRTRATHASGVDSCTLALDILDSLKAGGGLATGEKK